MVVQSFSRSVVWRLKRILLSLWLCLPLLLFGQTEFILDLNPVAPIDGISEVTFATKALNQLATEPYFYVVIHGKGNSFATFSNGDTKWVSVKPAEIATWIATKVPDTKTIVLLSSANQTATLQLVKKLATLDKTLERKLISWDEDVLLYENGHIKGYGSCREYQFNGKARTLYDKDIPSGKRFVAGKTCINLSNARNLLADWVEDWAQGAIQQAKKASNDAQKQVTDALQLKEIQTTLDLRLGAIENMVPRIKTAAYDLKGNKTNKGYENLIAKKDYFQGWFYLREIGNATGILGNINAWEQVTRICKLYTRNESLPEEERAAYDASFQVFSTDGGDMINTLQSLTAKNLSPEAFDKIVVASTLKKMLKDCFEEYAEANKIPYPTDLSVKRLAIIWSSEKILEKAMSEATYPLLPDLIWKEIQNLLTTTDTKYQFDETQEDKVPLKGIRGKFSETINSILGTGVKDPTTGDVVSLDWKTLLKITTPKTGLITVQGSRGALFEHWVREAWAKRGLFDTKQMKNGKEEAIIAPSNQGKLMFHFSAARVSIAAATTTSYKRVIDCSYTEKNTPEDEKKKRCELVGVELKHITGKLLGEPLQQLKDNATLVAGKKLRRIEYLFSTKKAADENLTVFINVFPANSKDKDFAISYIDNNGLKVKL